LSVQALNAIAEKYAGDVDFVMIYIREAHASDVWPLGNFYDIKNHQTIEDRKEAAKKLIEKGLKFPVLLDSMNGQFDSNYAVWPERYYIFQDNVITYISQPSDEFGFDKGTLINSIESLIIKNQNKLDQIKNSQIPSEGSNVELK